MHQFTDVCSIYKNILKRTINKTIQSLRHVCHPKLHCDSCKCRSKSQVSRWIVYRSHNLPAIHLSCQSKSRSCKMISNGLQIVDSPWLCMHVASCQNIRNVYKVPFLKFRQFWPIFPTHLIAQEHFNLYLNHYISLSTKPLGAFRFC